MPAGGRTYLCIDLKSFYASVECADRGLDPFTTNLVVADPDRTEKTICLAVSAGLEGARAAGALPRVRDPRGRGLRHGAPAHAALAWTCRPTCYSVYLRYVSPEDIHPYSIDECFIDATPYLSLYQVDARGFAVMLMNAVLAETGVCATAGIGPNLFLAKVALDIAAKHAEDHIGFLDQAEFERTDPDPPAHHRHLERRARHREAPGEVRRARPARRVRGWSEGTLYREFGVNAEYLIDHAHGVEPCTIADIRAYEPGRAFAGERPGAAVRLLAATRRATC